MGDKKKRQRQPFNTPRSPAYVGKRGKYKGEPNNKDSISLELWSSVAGQRAGISISWLMDTITDYDIRHFKFSRGEASGQQACDTFQP